MDRKLILCVLCFIYLLNFGHGFEYSCPDMELPDLSNKIPRNCRLQAYIDNILKIVTPLSIDFKCLEKRKSKTAIPCPDHPIINSYLKYLKVFEQADVVPDTRDRDSFQKLTSMDPVFKFLEGVLTMEGLRQNKTFDLNEMWFKEKREIRNFMAFMASPFTNVFFGSPEDTEKENQHWITIYGRRDLYDKLKLKKIKTPSPNLATAKYIVRHQSHSDEKKLLFFIGTKPSTELAIITVCLILFPDKECQFKVDNHEIKLLVVTRLDKGILQPVDAKLIGVNSIH